LSRLNNLAREQVRIDHWEISFREERRARRFSHADPAR